MQKLKVAPHSKKHHEAKGIGLTMPEAVSYSAGTPTILEGHRCPQQFFQPQKVLRSERHTFDHCGSQKFLQLTCGKYQLGVALCSYLWLQVVAAAILLPIVAATGSSCSHPGTSQGHIYLGQMLPLGMTTYWRKTDVPKIETSCKKLSSWEP